VLLLLLLAFLIASILNCKFVWRVNVFAVLNAWVAMAMSAGNEAENQQQRQATMCAFNVMMMKVAITPN